MAGTPTDRLTALQSLERRLVEAKGPDREIDKSLTVACLHIGRASHITTQASPTIVDPAFYADLRPFPRLTASIDAAVALAERVLPNMWIDISVWVGDDGKLRGAANIPGKAHGGRSRSPPALAVCLAIVKALIAKEVE